MKNGPIHSEMIASNRLLRLSLLAALHVRLENLLGRYHSRVFVSDSGSTEIESNESGFDPVVETERLTSPADSNEKKNPMVPDPLSSPGGFTPPSPFGGAPPDSGLIPKRPPADSTARAKYLTYERTPPIVAPAFKERVHPFFLDPTGGITRIVTIDSARNIVHIREQFNGKDIRVPLDIPLDLYIKMRYEFERHRRTREYVTKIREKQGDLLGNVFKNLTEFEIPVPPNPLMSIFGDKSKISLRITGSVDLSAGFRSESSDQQTVFINPTQTAPTFKQQVNVNVNGMIGDKLQITADWSTERTFEYENQLKINYKGYEDEIIQSIEAGNVSLQTPSSLVGGSGALFGIKGEFKIGPLKLTAIASQKKGEGSRLSISGGAQESKFERHAYQYSESHYFIDTLYSGNVYENFYNYRSRGSKIRIVTADLYIKDIEVWVTQPTSIGVVIDPLARDAVALITPETISTTGVFPQSYLDYLNPNNKVIPIAGEIEVGKFKKLTKDQDFTYNQYTGIITMQQSLQDDQVLAVAYRREGFTAATVDDEVFGTLVTDQRLSALGYTDDQGKAVPPRLVLKLVKPRNLNPAFKIAWKQLVKSIYSVGSRNLKKEDIQSIQMVYRLGGQTDLDKIENVNILQLFGLDQTNDADSDTPDERIDQDFIDFQRGEIIFPTTRPWDTGLQEFAAKKNLSYTKVAQFLYPAVYDTTTVIAKQSDRDKLMIVGTTRGASSSSYNLGFNLVPGSVRVTLDGRQLTPNVDYRVDDQLGIVTITNEAATVPGAKVDIDYERQDIFSFASKTLLGARGEIEFGKESGVGFSIFNLNQKTLSDKVRIGEEPINNTIMGVDARTRVELPFLTDALNTLPFMNTNEKSFFSIQGEGAFMMPDPNTKKSPIPSDNGEGIAYIDDFEGSRLYAPLQTAYSIWHIASVPAFHPLYNGTGAFLTDSIMHSHRARLNWYNLPIAQSNVVVTDIWPNRKAAIENQKVNVLELAFKPRDRGIYNLSPNVKDANPASPDTSLRSWGGVMRLLPINAYNLIDANFNYIEVWMKVDGTVQAMSMTPKMIIDIGKITEDVIPDASLNTEDDVIPGSIRNGILNPGEDVGLDMIDNQEEKNRYAAFIQQYGAQYPDMVGDPMGDNYTYNPNDWTNFNGTESNINDISGQFPDTEDLNTNGILDLDNSYFEYVVDLDTTKTINNTPNSYIVGGGFPNDGWFQFRIPITDYKHIIGQPSLTDVQYIRVWFTGVQDSNFNVRIAEFNLVGNQWIERLRNDSLFAVSVVNIEDNPEYTAPPGVIRPRDRTRPDQDILGNEQSLSLDFRSLPQDTVREAVRYFPSGIDLFNYSRLKLFVHGDPDLPYLNEKNYASEIVVRLGVDVNNYYEYRQPIRPGWDACNEVDIEFSKLTAIKTSRIDSIIIRPVRIPDPKIPGDSITVLDTTIISFSTDISVGNACGSVMRVQGRPDLIRVNFISIGVRHPKNDYPAFAITGQVWVNELRVTGVKDQNGIAFQTSMNVRFADFADLNATMNYSDPYFHGLADRFKLDRAYTSSLSVNTTISVDKILPKTWQGTQMKVSYTHSENMRKPILMPGEPDVEVEGSVDRKRQELTASGKYSERDINYLSEKVRIASQTFEVRDSWAIPTVRLRAPGDSWLITDVLNRLELSYNYSITRSRDPILEQRRQWQWTAHAGYSVDLNKEYHVTPFRNLFKGIFLLEDYKDWKLFYAPGRLGLNADMTRTRDEKRDRNSFLARPYERLFEHARGMNFSYQLSENGLLNLGGSYSAAIRTSLLRLETDPLQPVGKEQRQSSVIFNDIFFGRGGIYLGEPLSYDQQVSINSRPRLPRLFDIDRYFDVSGSYQVSYKWQTNLQQGDLGRMAAYNAGSNAQINFRWKSFFEPLFKFTESKEEGQGSLNQPRIPTPGRRLRNEELTEIKPDTTAQKPADVDSTQQTKRVSLSNILTKVVAYVIKYPFFEYENINFSFNQSTSSQNSGIRGQTGFSAFWTSPPFGPDSDYDLGPSRFYQLGLIATPNPRNAKLAFKSSFPFIAIEGADAPGYRAANNTGAYIDQYSQNSTFAFKTNRDLWTGAKLDLNWDLRWQYSKNTNIAAQQDGSVLIVSQQIASSVDRSYLAFPDLLFFKFFKTNIESVNEKFQRLQSQNPERTAENLSDAFEEGFEAIPFLRTLFGGMLPRVNWGFRWDGLEKIPFLSFADRIGIEHKYTSNISTKYRSNNGEPTITESKRVQYNFSPLLGVNMSFSKIWGGELSVNGRWNTQTGYDLNTSASNIVQNGSTEISITANFRKTGFDLPIFGISLKNDLDMSLAFSTNKSDSYTFQVSDLSLGGQPREGTTRITIEPRVRYVVSQRVTSSLFYRYQRTRPDAAVGSRIPGTTIHEGGIEIRLSISGS